MQSIYQKHPSIIINDGKEFLSEGMWVSKKVPIFIHNKKDSSYLPFSFCAICQKKNLQFSQLTKKEFPSQEMSASKNPQPIITIQKQ